MFKSTISTRFCKNSEYPPKCCRTHYHLFPFFLGRVVQVSWGKCLPGQKPKKRGVGNKRWVDTSQGQILRNVCPRFFFSFALLDYNLEPTKKRLSTWARNNPPAKRQASRTDEAGPGRRGGKVQSAHSSRFVRVRAAQIQKTKSLQDWEIDEKRT